MFFSTFWETNHIFRLSIKFWTKLRFWSVEFRTLIFFEFLAPLSPLGTPKIWFSRISSWGISFDWTFWADFEYVIGFILTCILLPEILKYRPKSAHNPARYRPIFCHIKHFRRRLIAYSELAQNFQSNDVPHEEIRENKSFGVPKGWVGPKIRKK